ncbi:hypothetical protein C8T65DRAFT_97420 [Cerioporus squamosus]|nr:hypothetical protein C8T65DRAFT_97420 [Cerioporus squamosus]
MTLQRSPLAAEELESVATRAAQHRHFSTSLPSTIGRGSEPSTFPRRKKKIHLPNVAYDILNDHFFNVSEWPDEPARMTLAEKLREIPGCEHYTAVHVYRYFGNMRSKTCSGPVKPRKSTVPLQEATESIESRLDVLLRENPNPSPEVAGIWAEKLGAGTAPEHILTYAFLWSGQMTSNIHAEVVEQQPTQLPGNPDPSLSSELRPPIRQSLPLSLSERHSWEQEEMWQASIDETDYAGCVNVQTKSVISTSLETSTELNFREDDHLAKALRTVLERMDSGSVNITIPKSFAELALWIEETRRDAIGFVDGLTTDLVV